MVLGFVSIDAGHMNMVCCAPKIHTSEDLLKCDIWISKGGKRVNSPGGLQKPWGRNEQQEPLIWSYWSQQISEMQRLQKLILNMSTGQQTKAPMWITHNHPRGK